MHTIIDKIKNNISKYNSFLKVDIENYYPTINHSLLMKMLRRKIKKTQILSLIDDAITKKTLLTSNEYVDEVKKGIPQGLSISNILSTIYLLDLDNLFYRKRVFAYFRFVDDILILHNNSDHDSIKQVIIKEFDKIDLKLNEDKIEYGKSNEVFNYLGYKNTPFGFSVRSSSLDRLRHSILKNFIIYKNSGDIPLSYLEWIINLRITGCKYDGNKYGWMFFYSQIDDIKILFGLDHFVAKLIKKYLTPKVMFSPKRFVRTYHEIKKNMNFSKYIPNFSDYDLSNKKNILNQVFLFKDPFSWDNDKVEKIFRIKIFQSIKDLEKDIQQLS